MRANARPIRRFRRLAVWRKIGSDWLGVPAGDFRSDRLMMCSPLSAGSPHIQHFSTPRTAQLLRPALRESNYALVIRVS
jgi:hypothetical protein